MLARLRCPPDSEPTGTSARLPSSSVPSTSWTARSAWSAGVAAGSRSAAVYRRVRRSGRLRGMMSSCGT